MKTDSCIYNFLILYSVREGSSAIVNTLSAQKRVHVPLFENLDHHRYCKHHAEGEIAQVLDAVYTTRSYVHASQAGATRLYQKSPEEIEANVKSVGFKWRQFGDPADLAPVLLKHRVKVFLLSRRDLVELSSSLYLSNERKRINNEKPHAQFGLVNLSGAEKETYRLRLEAFEAGMRIPAFARIMLNNVRLKNRKLKFVGSLKESGVPVRAIYYEDFQTDPDAFIRALMNELGFSDKEPIDKRCMFEKTMRIPSASRIIGLSWHRRLGYMWPFEAAYAMILRKVEKLAQGG